MVKGFIIIDSCISICLMTMCATQKTFKNCDLLQLGKNMHAIKLILFHILMTLRTPILVISKFLALVFLGGLTMIFCVEELSAVPIFVRIVAAMFGGMFTLIYWFYDYLIFYFKPKMLDIILLK